ncbi:hypothetical protein [Saccharothrix syringae]|uniref:Uncharacterized protein n=1 Tax=Saccharothrix syringae TaxID=103733 RepID=A0A5Q0GYN4_SACSY|nr:hypothetical protein [Saccharothrix syringae]QFZ18624.1 hypothetical protein EKG83_15185 [Saccharothrix syringae]
MVRDPGALDDAIDLFEQGLAGTRADAPVRYADLCTFSVASAKRARLHPLVVINVVDAMAEPATAFGDRWHVDLVVRLASPCPTAGEPTGRGRGCGVHGLPFAGHPPEECPRAAPGGAVRASRRRARSASVTH